MSKQSAAQNDRSKHCSGNLAAKVDELLGEGEGKVKATLQVAPNRG